MSLMDKDLDSRDICRKTSPGPQNLWSTDCDRVHLEQSLSRHGVKPGDFLVGNKHLRASPVENFSQKNLPGKIHWLDVDQSGEV